MAIPTQTATPGTPAEPGSCLSAVAPDRVLTKSTRSHVLYMHSTEQGKQNEALCSGGCSEIVPAGFRQEFLPGRHCLVHWAPTAVTYHGELTISQGVCKTVSAAAACHHADDYISKDNTNSTHLD